MLVQAGFKQGRSRIQASYQAEGIGERGLPKAIIVGASSRRTAYQSDRMSLPHSLPVTPKTKKGIDQIYNVKLIARK